MDELDVDLKRELSYSEVKGKRFHAARRLLQDDTSRWQMMQLALVMEATRYLTGWFMRRAKEVDHTCARPAIFDMAKPSTSPVHFCLQYLGTLLCGKGSRLILLWLSPLRESIQDWYDQCAEQVRAFRILLLTAAGQIRRRNRCEQWRIFLLADPLVDVAEKQAIVHEFVRSRVCCLPVGGLWQGLRKQSSQNTSC